MKNKDKHIVATADIDGKIVEFYRDGKREEFYTYPTYEAYRIEGLRNSIKNNNHLIRGNFNRIGYFYSDKFDFCSLYLPEVICYILKEFYYDPDDDETIDYKNIKACGQGDDYIIYSDKIDYRHAVNRYNDHFDGNL